MIKVFGAITVAFSIFMMFGWSFFAIMVRCKTRKNAVKKKWFQLSHTKINHPRHKYEKEYEEGKAWCRDQDMQDCYIRSLDDLILHACYLPAENAERYVILSHGYKGSGFGDFAYTARFLHENKCNLLFILPEGTRISFPSIFMGNPWGQRRCSWHPGTGCHRR